MAAFASVIVAFVLAWITWTMEQTQRVSPRMSAMMLMLAGITLITFATVNLLLVEEPVHVISGTLGTAILALGYWRFRRAGLRL